MEEHTLQCVFNNTWPWIVIYYTGVEMRQHCEQREREIPLPNLMWLVFLKCERNTLSVC